MKSRNTAPLFFLPVFFFCFLNSAAQEDTVGSSCHNAVKINLAAGIYKNISLYYEHAINKRTSLSLGASYILPREKPRIIRFENIGNRKSGSFTGFTATPEVKFYADKTAMKGLYLSVYLRIVYMSASLEMDIHDSSGVKPVTYKLGAEGSFSEYGAGVQFGYQWMIKDKFAIDFFFFGPKVSRYNLNYVASERADNTTDIDWQEVYADLEGTIQMPFGSRAEVQPGDNSIEFDWPFFAPSLRFGLSVGICF
ncbi:MAG: DUF3575 domain-containing protein [Flavobacteriales bacterium]